MPAFIAARRAIALSKGGGVPARAWTIGGKAVTIGPFFILFS